jgi:cell division inhibitor SepF
MAERLKRAAAWLGLVTDDRYGDDPQTDGAEELTEGIDRRDLDAHSARGSTAHGSSGNVTTLPTKRTVSTETTPSTNAPMPSASPSRTADMSRIVTVHPRTYNEARTIGEHFRDGVPVIMNLSEMEDVDAKRLVDFAAGLIFGLRGTIERVTSKVFLLSPQNVNVTAEDKERIAGGFFNQS